MSKKPPSQDQGNSRNEYIPSYITKAPFYAEGLSDGDYLEHQRLHATPKDTLDKAKWYDRGRKTGPAATKYRKGACENCGSMSHKTKECLERPRKIGAKWSGKDIQADDVQSDVKLGWDAKRDRWNGYDAREYSAVVKEYEDMEKMRQTSQSKGSQRPDDLDGEESTENDKAEAKYAEETDMGRSQPTSTRQLRLREDTAKYLLNLDLESAQYDPKTRSMDTTSQKLSNGGAESIAEEGFIRPSATSDDAAAFERAQKYAWETQESKSTSARMLHLQANPTEGEILFKKTTDETTAKKAAQRKALIDKYGEQPHLQQSSTSSQSGNNMKSKAITSSESYTEYDRHGNPKLPAGQVQDIPRSKYPEDILVNNHTSVFGSWWMNFQWGYACCHSTVRNSYCTGDAGRAAFEHAEDLRTGHNLLISADTHIDANTDANANKENGSDRSVHNGSEHKGNEVAGRLGHERNGKDLEDRNDERLEPLPSRKNNKRTLTDADAAVTEEELEAYKRSKMAADDPMRTWGKTDSEGLLDHGSSSMS